MKRTILPFRLRVLFAVAASLGTLSLRAQSFFSAEPAPRLFDIEIRAGVNSSVRTASSEVFDLWDVDSWGTGVEAGAVVNLNLRDFFTLQPGAFFESRSGNYAYSQTHLPGIVGTGKEFTQLGHYRTYHLTVPVMASFRFNVAPGVKWALEIGPYGQYNLKDSGSGKIQYMVMGRNGLGTVEQAKTRHYDYGVKLGTAVSVGRWSAGVHYLAGMRQVWGADVLKGRSKAWTFTAGFRL